MLSLRCYPRWLCSMGQAQGVRLQGARQATACLPPGAQGRDIEGEASGRDTRLQGHSPGTWSSGWTHGVPLLNYFISYAFVWYRFSTYKNVSEYVVAIGEVMTGLCCRLPRDRMVQQGESLAPDGNWSTPLAATPPPTPSCKLTKSAFFNADREPA